MSLIGNGYVQSVNIRLLASGAILFCHKMIHVLSVRQSIKSNFVRLNSLDKRTDASLGFILYKKLHISYRKLLKTLNN